MASVKGGSIGIIVGLAISSVGVSGLIIAGCGKGKKEIDETSLGKVSLVLEEPEWDEEDTVEKGFIIPEKPSEVDEEEVGETKKEESIVPVVEVSSFEEPSKTLPHLKVGIVSSNYLQENQVKSVLSRMGTYFASKFDLQLTQVGLNPKQCKQSFDVIVYLDSWGTLYGACRPGYSSNEDSLYEWTKKSTKKNVIQMVYGLTDLEGEIPKSDFSDAHPEYCSGIFLNNQHKKTQTILALSEKSDLALEKLEALLLRLVPEKKG